MDDRRCAAMLHSSRPDHILKRATSRVHVETVLIQNLCGEQIVVGFLDECVLRSLKSVSFSGGDPFPTRGKWSAAGLEVPEISEPGKSSLGYETRRDAHFARHLI